MDFASRTRAAEDMTRWKGIVVKSPVVPHNLAGLWNRSGKQNRMLTGM